MICDVISGLQIKLCSIFGTFKPDAIRCRLGIENQSSSLANLRKGATTHRRADSGKMRISSPHHLCSIPDRRWRTSGSACAGTTTRRPCSACSTRCSRTRVWWTSRSTPRASRSRRTRWCYRPAAPTSRSVEGNSLKADLCCLVNVYANWCLHNRSTYMSCIFFFVASWNLFFYVYTVID